MLGLLPPPPGEPRPRERKSLFIIEGVGQRPKRPHDINRSSTACLDCQARLVRLWCKKKKSLGTPNSVDDLAHFAAVIGNMGRWQIAQI